MVIGLSPLAHAQRPSAQDIQNQIEQTVRDEIVRQRLARPREQAQEAPSAEELRQKQAALWPDYQLKAAYANYIYIKHCYDARQGYLVIYISDAELELARRAVSRVEEKFGPQLPPGATTDGLWAQASAAPDPFPLVRELCQLQLQQFEQTYRQMFPADFGTKKDF